MHKLLSEAGRSFLRAFGGSLVVLLPGLYVAPDMHGAIALGVAALIASLAAGLKAIQVFVPRLSFKSVPRLGIYYVYVDSFVRAFIASLITALLGLLAMPEFGFEKSALIAILIAAVTTGFRAVQGMFTPGEPPSPQTGLNV